MALQTKTISANGSKGHHKFTLTVNEVSTNVDTNQSILSWSFQLSPIKTGYDWSFSSTTAMSYSVTVNGATYSGTLQKYDGYSTLTLAENTSHAVNHNPDGNKEISFSFSVESANYSYLTGSASNSGTMSLTWIPREAKITRVNDFNDEDNPTITYNNPAGSAVDSLAACISLNGNIDDIPYRSISKTGTSYTFSLTDTERKKLRQAVTSGWFREVSFHIRTIINGTTFFHSVKRNMFLVNHTPTLNATVEDTNSTTLALTGDKNKLVKYFSTARAKSGAAARKEATLSSQKITNGGLSGYSGDYSFTKIESGSFTFSATDSRGNSASTSVTKTLVNYVKLTSNVGVSKPSLTGEVTITLKGNYFSGSFGAVSNALNLEYRYKTNNGEYGNWVSITGAALKNSTYSKEHTLTIPSFNYQNSYTFQVKTADKLISLTSDEITVTALPVFDWGESDFNFNVPFCVNNVEQDFIVDSGTTGIWTWRKWNSGKAECWGIYTLKTAINTAWGNVFMGSTKMSRISYPVVFIGKPVENVTLQSGAYCAWLIPDSDGNGVNGGYASACYNVCRPTAVSSTETFYLSYHCVGKWK